MNEFEDNDDDVFDFETDEEGEAPPQYDPKAQAEIGEQVDKALASSGKTVPNPEGFGPPDPEAEMRAEEIRSGSAGGQAVGRSRLGAFGAGSEDIQRMIREAVRDAVGGPRIPTPTAETAVAEEQPVLAPAPNGQMPYLLVAEYGGRWQAWRFKTLEYLRGFAQNQPGSKRVFQNTDPGSEATMAGFQEITAQGVPVNR